MGSHRDDTGDNAKHVSFSAPAENKLLVISSLDDSLSSIHAEAELIDRWLGAAITSLFGDE